MRHFIYFEIIGQPLPSGLRYWYRLDGKPFKTWRGLVVGLKAATAKVSPKAYRLATISLDNEDQPPLYFLSGSTYAQLANFREVQ